MSIDNSDLALKPGMTATTRIVVDRRDEVLRVPRQALRFVPSGTFGPRASRTTAPSGDLQSHVWILRAGKPVAVPVIAGLDDGSFVEIAGGALEVGDQVIVAERSTAGRALPRPQL